MKIFNILVMLGLTLFVASCTKDTLNEDEAQDFDNVIKIYQDNLVSNDSIDVRMAKYESILSDDPILLINFKNFSEAPTEVGIVPQPQILRGKTDILNFQKEAYETTTWTALWYEIVDSNIGDNEGYAVVKGTHIVFKAGEEDPVYVQALEIFGLVKENNEWKLGTVSFIDYLWTVPKDGESTVIKLP